MKINSDNTETKVLSWGTVTSNTKVDEELKSTSKADLINISDIGKAFSKVEDTLNLGKPTEIDLSSMSKGERDAYISMLSKLFSRGVVGYEYVEVDGKKEKHFIDTEIGDSRLKNAKRYKEDTFTKSLPDRFWIEKR